MTNQERERIADNNYEEGIVSNDPEPDGFIEWSDDGKRGRTGTGWPKDVLVQAKKGDRVRVYGSFGQEIRGIDINGQMAFYRTQADRDRLHREWQEEHEREKQREYEKSRARMEATVLGLPDVFQRRIARFRAGRKDFDKEFLDYELVCCVDGLKIAGALKTPEAIEKFQKLDYKAQMKAVPGLSDQHSGNSFGFAVRLGWLYLKRPESVEWEHGALVPLVGCADYGCTHEPAKVAHKAG